MEDDAELKVKPSKSFMPSLISSGGGRLDLSDSGSIRVEKNDDAPIDFYQGSVFCNSVFFSLPFPSFLLSDSVGIHHPSHPCTSSAIIHRIRLHSCFQPKGRLAKAPDFTISGVNIDESLGSIQLGDYASLLLSNTQLHLLGEIKFRKDSVLLLEGFPPTTVISSKFEISSEATAHVVQSDAVDLSSVHLTGEGMAAPGDVIVYVPNGNVDTQQLLQNAQEIHILSGGTENNMS